MGNQHQGGAGGGVSQAGAGGYSASPSTVPRRSFKQQEPMPLKEEVERRFEELVKTMDLSDERKRTLLAMSVEKKWTMLATHPSEPAKHPREFLSKMKNIMAEKDHKKARKKYHDAEFLKSLHSLSTSLRTNGLSWTLQFLSKDCQGLEVLVQYLQYRYKMESELNQLSQHDEKERLMEADSAHSDLHICVICMKSLMNTTDGFRAATQHPNAITSLAQTMFFGTMKTVITVLELLAAVCLVRGGHEKIIAAVDNFKVQQGETHRFEKLVRVFRETGLESPEFATICMTFINVVVHTCEDLNYRVYMQHEFTLLGVDKLLEELEGATEDFPTLHKQIKAYQDNYFNVATLLEDSTSKGQVYNRAVFVERQLKELQEAHKKAEYQSIKKIAELEKKVYDLKRYVKTLHDTVPSTGSIPMPASPVTSRPTSAEVPSWVAKDLSLEIKPMVLVPAGHLPNLSHPGDAPPPLEKKGSAEPAQPSGTGPTGDKEPTSPPTSTGEQPPPPPPTPGVPPPPPGGLTAQGMKLMPTLAIKQRYQPKYRLPHVNWAAIPATKVEGTIFSEMNEETVMEKVTGDMETFEEMFKTKSQETKEEDKKEVAQVVLPSKQPAKEQVLDTSRIRNVAISLHKIKKPVSEVKSVIELLDVERLRQEEVDILMKIAPTEEDMKKFHKFVDQKKDIKSLSVEEQFLFELGGVERLPVRLRVMNFMHTLPEDMLLVKAQIDSLVAASSSLLGCQGLKRVFEVILTFGNYMNSGRRGPVYGFKIQSLDLLLNTRSTDRKTTLLQYIVQLMRERFPEHAEFSDEVLYLKKAGLVSLDQLSTDVRVMAETFQMAVGELVKEQDNIQLRDFVIETEGKVSDLKDRFQMAEDTYHKVVKFYGEDPKTAQPGQFFNEFARFIAAYKKAEAEIEVQRHRAEMAKKEEARKAEALKAKENKALVGGETEKKLQVLDQVEEGTIDELISGIQTTAFRAKVLKAPTVEATDFGGVFMSLPVDPIADYIARESAVLDDL